MNSPRKAAGQVTGPLVIFGLLAMLLGIVSEVVGAFSGMNEGLRGLWESGGWVFERELGVPDAGVLLVMAVASFGLIGGILTTSGRARRVILGVSVIFLGVGMSPVMAVWGVFWEPFGVLLAVGWAWFSASVYASRHLMPCEVDGNEEAKKEEVILSGESPVVRVTAEKTDEQG